VSALNPFPYNHTLTYFSSFSLHFSFPHKKKKKIQNKNSSFQTLLILIRRTTTKLGFSIWEKYIIDVKINRRNTVVNENMRRIIVGYRDSCSSQFSDAYPKR
jgi:hypothetical protein